jgi:hypothetical protein
LEQVKIALVVSELWRILPGLPPYGPLVTNFSPNGRGGHSEGFVVEISPSPLQSWVGNFQRGDGSLDKVIQHPDDRHVIVVAGGQGYIIDALSRELTCLLESGVSSMLIISDQRQVVVSDDIRLQLVGSQGLIWSTRRIAWDGIQELRLDGDFIRGQAWNVIDDCWDDFAVDLETGSVAGGAYAEDWPE